MSHENAGWMSPTALEGHEDEITAYAMAQAATVSELRARDMHTEQTPWPARDDAMMQYLIRAGTEMAETGSLQKAITWAVITAWREGAVDRTADIVAAFGDKDVPREVFTDERRPSQPAPRGGLV